ncbi:MAG: HAD family hydrolase [Oscillospiraceae bacterium]|jgi:HAD superfamily hydrolase (TIGR01509 family)|nr:HAD family hydrolase [Oscillospiraceae bacterium]
MSATITALLLDCGGVMVAPVTGDWIVPPGYQKVLGADFMEKGLADFRRVRGKYEHLIPDAHRMDSDAAEHRQLIHYLRAVFQEMAWPLSDAQLDALAHAQVYDDTRYLLFDDVLPYLKKWRGRYKLGIVSDAPPSTRRIMDKIGISALLDAATYSCDVGALKPDQKIYQATMDKLGVSPEHCVYVDDIAGKIRGATALGAQGVQMIRPMPEGYSDTGAWDGAKVRDFAELDAWLLSQEIR